MDCAELAPPWAVTQDRDHPADREKDGSVLGEECQAGCDAGGVPVDRTIPLQRAREKQERESPEQDQRRVHRCHNAIDKISRQKQQGGAAQDRRQARPPDPAEAKYIATHAAIIAIVESQRTPNSVSPKTAVPARIVHAIIGG